MASQLAMHYEEECGGRVSVHFYAFLRRQ